MLQLLIVRPPLSKDLINYIFANSLLIFHVFVFIIVLLVLRDHACKESVILFLLSRMVLFPGNLWRNTLFWLYLLWRLFLFRRFLLDNFDLILCHLRVHINICCFPYLNLSFLLLVGVSDLSSLLSKENSVFTLIHLLFERGLDVDTKNSLAVNSKLLDAVLNLFVYVPRHSVVYCLDVIQFLLECLKKLCVFVV